MGGKCFFRWERRRRRLLWHNSFFNVILTLVFQAARGGISVDTERAEKKTTSRLTVADVKAEDSGNYTCKPAHNKPHSIVLVVIEGIPAKLFFHLVMQHTTQQCQEESLLFLSQASFLYPLLVFPRFYTPFLPKLVQGRITFFWFDFPREHKSILVLMIFNEIPLSFPASGKPVHALFFFYSFKKILRLEKVHEKAKRDKLQNPWPIHQNYMLGSVFWCRIF